MAVYEVAFDVEIDWHEYIEAEDDADAEELAAELLDTDKFYHYIIDRLKNELSNNPYIEPNCICESTSSATITKDGLAVMEAGNEQDAV